MAVIAVAGGTGPLGHAIVDAFVAEGKHKVVVLARQTSESKEKELGTPILAVDYSDIDALAKVLETNKVEIVISTLNLMQGSAAEHAVIQAAAKSSTTKRYIANNWGIHYTDEVVEVFPFGKVKLGLLEALEATSLEYTAVLNGYFFDYFVLPKVKSYLNPLAFVLDIAQNHAAIPGSGDVPFVLTHTWDIARFVTALVDQPKWEKESVVIGDRTTFNELLRLVEEVKGAKFTVVHDSLEKLRTGQITELPSHPYLYPYFPKEAMQGLFSSFGILFDQGAFDLRPACSLNDQFPEIKTRTIKELITEAWKET